jgi:hypothetical protein
MSALISKKFALYFCAKYCPCSVVTFLFGKSILFPTKIILGLLSDNSFNSLNHFSALWKVSFLEQS